MRRFLILLSAIIRKLEMMQSQSHLKFDTIVVSAELGKSRIDLLHQHVSLFLCICCEMLIIVNYWKLNEK